MRVSTLNKISGEIQSLGFRKSSQERKWYQTGNELTITVAAADNAVVLAVERLGLSEKVLSPSAADFEDRFKKKLAAFRRKALRLYKRDRRDRKTKFATLVAREAAEKESHVTIRINSIRELLAYEPLEYCKKCKRLLRQSFMKTEDACLGCWEDKPRSTRRSKR